MPTIFSFDPSINDIGWCVKTNLGSWEGGTISLPSEFNLPQRLNRIKRILHDTVYSQSIEQIVYEQPTFMTSTKGKIAAQKGYTIDLGIVCGFIIGCFDISPHDTFCYTPQQWKGSVPKRVTEAKYYREFSIQDTGDRHISDHEIDATMLLKYHCEKMKYL